MLGDVFGLLALALISATAVLMLLRRRILKRFKNLELMRRVHIAVAGPGRAVPGAARRVLHHLAPQRRDPPRLCLGALALVVWVTGTAFLERFRDSLYFHGTLSLSAISLMVIHSAAAGLNVPFAFAEVVLVGTTVVAVYKTTQYVGKMRDAGGLER